MKVNFRAIRWGSLFEAEIARCAKPSEPDGETNTRREVSDWSARYASDSWDPSGSLPFFESLMDFFIVHFL